MSATSRGASAPLFHLITPANRMPSQLPWFPESVLTTLLVTPRTRRTEFFEAHLLCREAMSSERIEPDGELESFLYVIAGTLRVVADSDTHVLAGAGRFAYVGVDDGFSVHGATGTAFLWVRRPWVSAPIMGALRPPATFASDRAACPEEPLAPPGVWIRRLVPSDIAFDFAVNLMRFTAGSELGMVEIHDEDHGLYLLRGHGIYGLDGLSLPVEGDDFIYMAPYCPQHFAAEAESEYLLFKPANRFPGQLASSLQAGQRRSLGS